MNTQKNSERIYSVGVTITVTNNKTPTVQHKGNEEVVCIRQCKDMRSSLMALTNARKDVLQVVAFCKWPNAFSFRCITR